MGNICCNICCDICCDKKKDDNTSLLQNTIHCHYCNKTLVFNDYYKHLTNCKRKEFIYGDV